MAGLGIYDFIWRARRAENGGFALGKTLTFRRGVHPCAGESEKRATLKIANVIYGVSETGEAHLDDTVLSQP